MTTVETIDALLDEADTGIAAAGALLLATAMDSVRDLLDHAHSTASDAAWYAPSLASPNQIEHQGQDPRPDDEDDPGSDPRDFQPINVHSETKCLGRHCVMHNPSNHHMRQWPLIWRADHGIFERRCVCGIGHPDPDQFNYWELMGRSYMSVHGCDGCCRP